mmetsp:Transcript_24209/g.67134  ORF Transcript_24209/g.67134 Transcript_24209/m.67134 type:complete len:604 (+) Transcript_24209:207-2018(+)
MMTAKEAETNMMSQSRPSISSLLQHHHTTLVVCCFLLSTTAKVLLFPAYRSTDFDVHRHWKALTLQLNSSSEWYFDDRFVSTVHTLDYPPAFAFFEWLWSNGYWRIATFLLPLEDETTMPCLSLQESGSTEELESRNSVFCVTFMRSTVLISELVYWIACYTWARLVVVGDDEDQNGSQRQPQEEQRNTFNFHWKLFLLLSLNPALLWLDHVHFQYNAFLLGILLLSLACLWKGQAPATPATTATNKYNNLNWNMAGAVLFALLLTLKHLYLGLALWYFCYLLRIFCFVDNDKEQSGARQVFSLSRLILLGFVTVLTLLIPFLPFLSQQQLIQIAQRLFPFGRGLVHDYWAGNIWAFYMAAQKVLPFLPKELPPLAVAMVLLVSLLPGCYGAWMAGGGREKQRNSPDIARRSMLVSFAYSALASFMTAYHVHEKAIVTTLLPLTILWSISTTTKQTTATKPNDDDWSDMGLLLFRTQAFALLGLLPLLFPATELAMKCVTFCGYLILLHLFVAPYKGNTTMATATPLSLHWNRGTFLGLLLKKPWRQLLLSGLTISFAVTFLEVVPITMFGRFEFIPLALTSLSVASFLMLSFVELLCMTVSL